MKVTNKEQAWAEVNKIFPTDYEKDEGSSQRAGYDVYRHPTLNYYTRICDLGNRLEVLTGEYGETVTNIWIVETEDTTEEAVAKTAHPIIARQVYEMTFAVMGSTYTEGAEKELYNKLSGEYANAAASDFVVAWCKINGGWGKKWGSVRISGIEHYKHGEHGGHYCITALMEECEKEEE